MQIKRILHITESYGGGVTTALLNYVKYSPEHQHYLFATIRENDATGEEISSVFNEQKIVKRSLFALLNLRNWLHSLNPDFIHLHSSFAGGIGRLLPFIDARKIIYTPHCYSFYRDDALWKCRLYRGVEQLLLKRTAIVAGCCDHETRSAKQLGAPKSLTLTNVCEPIDTDSFSHVTSNRNKPCISMLGRICEQKGYRYFSKVASFFRGQAQFIWIGGGDKAACEVLREAGVEVTGWQTRERALQLLSKSDLYLHCAKWDGFPISVLEAAELQIPIVLRYIDSFSFEGLDCFMDVESAIDGIKTWLEQKPELREIALSNLNTIIERHSINRLEEDLARLYQ